MKSLVGIVQYQASNAGHTGAAVPPARRRACPESARGITIVSLRTITKFDDRSHPLSTRAGSSRSEVRLGVGTLLCVPGARLCNSVNLFIYQLKVLKLSSGALVIKIVNSDIKILLHMFSDNVCKSDVYHRLSSRQQTSAQVYRFVQKCCFNFILNIIIYLNCSYLCYSNMT